MSETKAPAVEASGGGSPEPVSLSGDSSTVLSSEVALGKEITICKLVN